MDKFISTGILVTLALLPAYLLRANIFGIPTTFLEIMLLILIILWLIQNRKRLKELFAIKQSWTVFIALVIVAATVSAIIAPDIFSALGIWKAYIIEPILFFYLLVDLLKRKQITNERVLIALCVGGLLAAVTAILQWILWAGIPIPWDIERRVTGLFDYPNALGLFLGPLTIVSLTLIMKKHLSPELVEGINVDKKSRKKILLYFIFIILFLLAIIFAQSEAALASIIVTGIMMGIMHHKFRKPTIVISCLALLIIFSIPTTRVFLINKILLQDYSGQVRLSQWKETVELLKDHPIAGAGLSQYPNALKPYHKDTQYEIFQYPHNIFLNIWVELGLLGLLTFFYFIYLTFQTFRSFPTFFLFFPFLQIFLHGLVDVPYFKNDLAVLIWTLIALFYVESLTAKSKS
ncbi:O-antigen ligase family protein [Candidatus Uhrbacteria bacterium]|nr:O-antigen ligase family protein [Candidatus Uhrbacteria bacterium]